MSESNSPPDLQGDVVLSDGSVMTVEALVDRVTVLEPGIVLMRESTAPRPTRCAC